MARGGARTLARSSRARYSAHPARAGILALMLLVLAAALCTKALGHTGGPAVPHGPVPGAAAAQLSAASDGSAAGAVDDGPRCAKKHPSTESQPAPQPADLNAAQAAAEPRDPPSARVPRLPDPRTGPAPPESRHLLLSVLRI